MMAAASRNRVLAVGGRIPWHLPRDVAHFRARAAGRWLLLGRGTYEQMEGWFRPGQVPLVLTRQKGYKVPEGHAVGSVEEALARAAAARVSEVLVCGGGQVYEAALPMADEVILTTVDCEIAGEVLFPELGEEEWQRGETTVFPADAAHAWGMSIATYCRKAPPVAGKLGEPGKES